jgi:AAA family ATP:ADP antiporter
LTVAAFAVLALLPVIATIMAVQAVRRAVHFAIERPSREILFTDIPREQRYKSKNFIDTVVYRGGDAVTAWISAGLSAVGFGIVPVSAAAVALSFVWLWNSLSIARKDEALEAR